MDWQQELFQRRRFGVRTGLQAIEKVYEALEHPAHQIPAIHVVGTNGKGSTAAMCAHALSSRVAKVGLFTSPHLHRLGERIRIGEQELDDERIKTILAAILATEAQVFDQPTLSFFELITLIAMQAFQDAKAELLVMEAGLGGRWDATRIAHRQICLFTPFAMDHMAYLGPTLAAITGEKIAVIEPGMPCFSAPQAPEVVNLMTLKANEQHTQVTWVEPLDHSPQGLAGEHQRINGALALAGARYFFSDLDALSLDGVRWPGRLERIAVGRGAVIFDVAHNPHGIATFVEYIQSKQAKARIIVFGCMSDKDYPAMLHSLEHLKMPIWLVAANQPNACEPQLLAQYVVGGIIFTSIHDPQFQSAWTNHLQNGGEILVCGSVYLVAELRAWILNLSQDDIALSDPLKRIIQL